MSAPPTTPPPPTGPPSAPPRGPAGPQQGRIVVEELTKVFGGGVRAVDRLSFTVEPGSVTGFLGPNGAGKTTTLRMVLGLVSATSGRATIGGQTYKHLGTPSRVVGAALEASSFHPARTARNHLRILCTVAGLPTQRADQVLEMVGLRDAARRKVRGYSMGMRQRLGLAAALVGDPRVIVLDEPANGLDPDGIRWLRGLLRHLADEGRTVLVSSHQLNEVQEVADRVVILNHGQLVRQGSIDELTAGNDVVVVRSPDPRPLAEAAQQAGGQIDGADGLLRVRNLPIEQVGHLAFTAGVELRELSLQRFDLEDLFFALTAQQPGAHQGQPPQGQPPQGAPGSGLPMQGPPVQGPPMGGPPVQQPPQGPPPGYAQGGPR